jgi:uncharacterized protein with von Willebrand factor type A (vWA) domain
MPEDPQLSSTPLEQVNSILRGRYATLGENLLGFTRLLRVADLDVTNGRVIDAARSLTEIGIDSREDVRAALRASLVSSVDQVSLFNALFDLYWSSDLQRVALLPEQAEHQRSEPESQTRQTGRVPIAPAPAAKPTLENPGRTYSEIDLLTQKDFSSYSNDDIRSARRLLRRLAAKLATALGRRRRVSSSRGAVDLRRSIRRSVHHGGEVLDLVRARPRVHKLRLVVLCDISGSMDVYSRFLVQFLYALQNELRGVSTFVFSTRLNEVTHLLRTRSFDQALELLATRVDSWSGGTSIGASLYAFDRHYSRRRIGSRTVIVVISDGWDRGETALLTKAMQSFRRRAFKVIWLNPLLGNPGYRPLAKGMAAALPYVDYFLPAHNLESLARLGRSLVRLARD